MKSFIEILAGLKQFLGLSTYHYKAKGLFLVLPMGMTRAKLILVNIDMHVVP